MAQPWALLKTLYGGLRMPLHHRQTRNGRAVSWLVESPDWESKSKGMLPSLLGRCWHFMNSSLNNMILHSKMEMMRDAVRFARLPVTSFSPFVVCFEALRSPRFPCICCKQKSSGRMMQIWWLTWPYLYKESSRLS